MKAHEETWVADWGSHDGYDCMTSAHSLRSAGTHGRFATFDADRDVGNHEKDLAQGARARLAAQAPAMARLLLDMMCDRHCPLCGAKVDRTVEHGMDGDEPNWRSTPRYHRENCALSRVLVDAGVIAA